MTGNPDHMEFDLEQEFEPEAWAKKGFSERVRISCSSYVLHGMSLPIPVYIYHAVKVMILMAGWMFFASFTPGLGDPRTITEWGFHPMAFQKAFLWACCFEVLGLGCMSGPLGLRVWPPHTAFLHFSRPGTTKLAMFPGAPVIGGKTRTPLDALLYLAYLATLIHALIQPELTTAHLLPVIIALPLAGMCDKTIFLAARVEHHWTMVLCITLAGMAGVDFVPACMWVQLGIWFWAGVSKLTRAFAYVVPIMTANNPLLKSPTLRKKLFVAYPDDLTPSLLAKVMAHSGGFLEFAAPITLVAYLTTGYGPLLYLGMFWVIMLHGFIISNMPIGAVFEWNILSLYAGFFLFWAHPDANLFAVGSPDIVAVLIVGMLLLPALGNIVPKWVSFLVSMRYYAGNWAWAAWYFTPEALVKMEKLKRAAPLLFQQQRAVFPPKDALKQDIGFLAFRTLHLQGRVLGMVLPKILEGRDFHDYEYADGETVAASIVGWNFGEGHLCDEQLLEAIQEQCDFEDGDIRALFVESQPFFGSTLHWRVCDAKRGQLHEGHVELDELATRKPWDCG